ncbi:hypothetical protein Fmac_007788 [Flemingia macrophylla]|uniref:DUF4283 domain-containing protein n=1 Tax=Flemingia macrophylla TaxID=520843 RepID=A0ABD1MVK2_9FABA
MEVKRKDLVAYQMRNLPNPANSGSSSSEADQPEPVHSRTVHRIELSRRQAFGDELTLPYQLGLFIKDRNWSMLTLCGHQATVTVGLIRRTVNVKFGYGWREFCSRNKVKPGDTICITFPNEADNYAEVSYIVEYFERAQADPQLPSLINLTIKECGGIDYFQEDEAEEQGSFNHSPKDKILDDEFESWCNKWRSSLVVHVLGKSMGFKFLESKLEKLCVEAWKVRIVDFPDEYFLMQYSFIDDYKITLFEGLWMISKHSLVVQR